MKSLDGALTVGGPVEGAVVEDHGYAVLGGLHVGLDVPVAEVDRRLEGHHGVLQRRPVSEAATAMSERQRQPVVVEVRVVGRRVEACSQREYDGRGESVDMRHTDDVRGG